MDYGIVPHLCDNILRQVDFKISFKYKITSSL